MLSHTGSCVLVYSSLLSGRHTPLSFWPGKRSSNRGRMWGAMLWDEAIPDGQWGSPWCGAHGPLERGGVVEWWGWGKWKGLLQVSLGIQAKDGVPRSSDRTRRWSFILHFLNIWIQVKIKTKKTKNKSGSHTAYVLLEFMHKSNNTKRNERWGNSRK